MMTKKYAMLLVLFVFLVLIAGCETVKGGIIGAAEGFQRDWKNFEKTDAWMRKNLW